jgi:hypothetical protein
MWEYQSWRFDIRFHLGWWSSHLTMPLWVQDGYILFSTDTRLYPWKHVHGMLHTSWKHWTSLLASRFTNHHSSFINIHNIHSAFKHWNGSKPNRCNIWAGETPMMYQIYSRFWFSPEFTRLLTHPHIFHRTQRVPRVPRVNRSEVENGPWPWNSSTKCWSLESQGIQRAEGSWADLGWI